MRMSLFIFCLTLLFSFSVEANKKSSQKSDERKPANLGSFICGYVDRTGQLQSEMNNNCNRSKNFSIARTDRYLIYCCIGI